MSVGEFWTEKGVQKNEWVLNHVQNAPSSLSGDSVVTDFGEPFWIADVSIEVPIRSELERQWSAFFRRRQGQKISFTMNRSFRSFAERGGFNPSAPITITSTSRTTRAIRVTNHGAGRVSEGDMFGYYTEEQGFYIGEVDGIIENGALALEFTVYPPPFAPHSTTPAPRFTKAVGEFRLDGEPSPSETSTSRSWSFTATQVIRG